MQGFKNISEKLGRANEYDLTKGQDDAQVNNRKGISRLGYRHLVAMWCFFYISMSNAHFSLLPITIVAMVNRSQPTNQIRHTNASIVSCPLPLRTENVSTNIKIEGTFNWDSELQGYALGVGSFGYMITNVFAGRIAETYGAKRTLWIADFCGILCTCICPFVAGWSIYAFITVLFLRGFIQGAIVPSVFIMMANWFPRKERGLLSGFALCGVSVGAASSGIVFGTLCDIPSLGWQSAFYFLETTCSMEKNIHIYSCACSEYWEDWSVLVCIVLYLHASHIHGHSSTFFDDRGSFGFSLCVVGVLIAKCDKTTNIVCCILALMFSGIGVSGTWIVSGDMSPVFSGTLSGISSCVAMFTCSLMPVIVGALTKNGTLDEWQIVFGIHIAFAVTSGLIFHIFGSADIQPWNSMGSPEVTNQTAAKSDKMDDLRIEEKTTTMN